METGYYLSFICRFKYHSFESLYIHNIGVTLPKENDTAGGGVVVGGDKKSKRGVKPLCYDYLIPLRFKAC